MAGPEGAHQVDHRVLDGAHVVAQGGALLHVEHVTLGVDDAGEHLGATHVDADGERVPPPDPTAYGGLGHDPSLGRGPHDMTKAWSRARAHSALSADPCLAEWSACTEERPGTSAYFWCRCTGSAWAPLRFLTRAAYVRFSVSTAMAKAIGP